MTKDIVLSDAARKNITAIKTAEEKIARISERLATGKRVNSVIDDPRNFTAASELMSRTRDMSKLLDGIGQNIRVIDEALNGVEAISHLLDHAEVAATESLEKLLLGEDDPKVIQQGSSFASERLQDVIQADSPLGYWQFDGSASNIGSLAGVDGISQNGVTFGGAPLYYGGGGSAEFNGVDQGIGIPSNAAINTTQQPQRTVELVFNADTTAGRQVLYEEGGIYNAFSIYIDNGRLYATGRDQADWGPANISTPISAGQTYHVAFVFDWTDTQTFQVYVDGSNIGSVPVNVGFAAHSGAIGVGYSPDGTWYHDGASTFPNYFDGRISDLALYNDALSAAQIQARADTFSNAQTSHYINIDYQNLIEQIDNIAEDAHYRGINLLKNEDMTTYFNQTYTSSLLTEGEDFTIKGLGLLSHGFKDIDTVRDIIDRVRAAQDRVEQFGTRILHDLSIMKTRNINLEESIITHQAGADDLTQADMNEEGANLLAASTRLTLSQTSLALAADFNKSILNVLSGI